jgi:hypothetical protein
MESSSKENFTYVEHGDDIKLQDLIYLQQLDGSESYIFGDGFVA